MEFRVKILVNLETASTGNPTLSEQIVCTVHSGKFYLLCCDLFIIQVESESHMT